MANVNFNFHKPTNPHQQRPDHLAAALSKLGGDLISDAMANRRQASLDKKQDERTKLSNERIDARNLIKDKQYDDKVLLDAQQRSEDSAYRDAESGRTAQYRQDTLKQNKQFNTIQRAGEARDAANTVTAAEIKAQTAKEKALLKSYQDEHKVLVESMSGEYAQTPNPSTVKRVKSLELKMSALRGEPPIPKKPTIDDTIAEKNKRKLQTESSTRVGQQSGQMKLLDSKPTPQEIAQIAQMYPGYSLMK